MTVEKIRIDKAIVTDGKTDVHIKNVSIEITDVQSPVMNFGKKEIALPIVVNVSGTIMQELPDIIFSGNIAIRNCVTQKKYEALGEISENDWGKLSEI